MGEERIEDEKNRTWEELVRNIWEKGTEGEYSIRI
jgi:hypothetical protein